MVQSLQNEIRAGMLDLVMETDSVRVRVRENDSFQSGSARLQRAFHPILDKIAAVLDEAEGRIVVAGHTDNVPISTNVFPSNWVLSAARAANVVHYMAEVRKTDPGRMEIRAYADTRPIADNDSSDNRARNRRVEIIVNYEQYPTEAYELNELKPQKKPDTDGDAEGDTQSEEGAEQ